MNYSKELFLKVETFLNMIVSVATGGEFNDAVYKDSRQELINEPLIKDKLPRFITTCRDIHQFWSFIKQNSGTYKGRREFLWSSFSPLMEFLENNGSEPTHRSVEEALKTINSPNVSKAWKTAYNRRASDPDGAITAARTFMESTCKVILDRLNIPYTSQSDLNGLYKLVADKLEISPTSGQHKTFKKIFSGSSTLIIGITELRNHLGDAHGKGEDVVVIKVRHAELAVNIAGAIATYLISTFEEKRK